MTLKIRGLGKEFLSSLLYFLGSVGSFSGGVIFLFCVLFTHQQDGCFVCDLTAAYKGRGSGGIQMP